MPNLLPFFVMSELDSAQFRDATAAREHRLEPRKVEAGPHRGKYALPARVARSADFADLAAAFAVMTEVAMDADEAWPQTGEE